MMDIIVETTVGKLRGTIANSIQKFVGIPNQRTSALSPADQA